MHFSGLIHWDPNHLLSLFHNFTHLFCPQLKLHDMNFLGHSILPQDISTASPFYQVHKLKFLLIFDCLHFEYLLPIEHQDQSWSYDLYYQVFTIDDHGLQPQLHLSKRTCSFYDRKLQLLVESLTKVYVMYSNHHIKYCRQTSFCTQDTLNRDG